jgi:nucleoside-diphosphate-sugar epimerase
MKSALIGHTGFVGGNLLGQQSFSHLYNSKNIGEIAGESFDRVVCCGAPAAMWVANQNPDNDWKVLQSLMEPLKSVAAKEFVLISTIAVYPRPVGVDEDSPIDPELATPYGRHRYALERFIREQFNGTVIRLPGLFGPGIKKNIIFDFLNNNNVEQINSKATYQFYDLGNLTRDIKRAQESGISVLNVSSAPTSVAEVATRCFGREFLNEPAGTPAFFDYRSKHAGLWSGKDGYLYSKEQVFAGLSQFINSYRTEPVQLGVGK